MEKIFFFLLLCALVNSQSIVPIGNTTDYIQIGSKLQAATEGSVAPEQGSAVAMSADGTILVVGAPFNNNSIGTIWVYGYDSATQLWVSVAGPLGPDDNTGTSHFGSSVAVSANGLVIAVGGPHDATPAGAAWIFVFDGLTTWTQQGSKLIVGLHLGTSIALSGDGTWLAVGAPLASVGLGIVWIFNYDGTTWNQQVNPLKGLNLNLNYNDNFGTALSFSKDGLTLAVGVRNCNFTTSLIPSTTASGCTLIYYRNADNGMWSQAQSNLLFVYTNTSALVSVAISGDGNIVAAGSPTDITGSGLGFGAVCIYNISANPFTVYPCITINATLYGGTAATFAQSVTLSHDGYTLAVGAPLLNSSVGGTFLFTNNGTQWIQTQAVLIGSNANGTSVQGSAISMSYDGKVLAVGGLNDASGAGATWIFGIAPTPTPAPSSGATITYFLWAHIFCLFISMVVG
jgi:hypothetical protein